MTETWTTAQYRHYRETGEKPRSPESTADSPQSTVDTTAPDWIKQRISEAVVSEKALQSACEGWLSLQGCLRMTADMAANEYERKQRHQQTLHPIWFGHLVESERNAFLPDIFAWTIGRVPFLCELKVRNKWRPGQLEMVVLGEWRLACTLDQFRAEWWQWANGDDQAQQARKGAE